MTGVGIFLSKKTIKEMVNKITSYEERLKKTGLSSNDLSSLPKEKIIELFNLPANYFDVPF